MTRDFPPAPLKVVEQRHKAEVHVQLLMAVEESEAGVVGYEGDFDLLIATQHDDIFEDSGGRLTCELVQFEAVAVKVDGMNVVASIAHANAIALALLQVKRRWSHLVGHRICDAVDGPAIEAFFSCVVLYEEHVEGFVGLGQPA